MHPAVFDASKEPQARHSATVIWLHGLGDTGEGWMDVGPQLQMKLPFAAWLCLATRLSLAQLGLLGPLKGPHFRIKEVMVAFLIFTSELYKSNRTLVQSTCIRNFREPSSHHVIQQLMFHFGSVAAQ